MDAAILPISDSIGATVGEGGGGARLAVDEDILHLVVMVVLMVMVVPGYINIDNSITKMKTFIQAKQWNGRTNEH